MSMTACSTTISVNPTSGACSSSGTGMADAIGSAVATALPTVFPFSTDPSLTPTQVAIDQKTVIAQRTGMAGLMQAVANAVASGVINHITANAQVNAGTLAAHVSTQILGRTPNPNNANTNIQAPSSPVDVPLTGTGTIS